LAKERSVLFFGYLGVYRLSLAWTILENLRRGRGVIQRKVDIKKLMLLTIS